jgi:hypothetical protein
MASWTFHDLSLPYWFENEADRLRAVFYCQFNIPLSGNVEFCFWHIQLKNSLLNLPVGQPK